MIVVPFLFNCLFNFAIGLLLAKLLGPAEYGRYALVMSIALVLQMMCLEWLRLCAVRFYSEEDRLARPEIRATLDLTFVVIVGAAAFVAIVIAGLGVSMPISKTLIVLAIFTASTMGLFELAAALLRARFHYRAYGTFVILKNVLSLALTAGGAWYTGSALVALGGFMLSTIGSFILCYRLLNDRAAHIRQANRALFFRFAAYGLPIVIANVFFQSIPMVNRSLVSQLHGFAEAGQLALAYDIGYRIINSVGSALDVLLFQIAIAADRNVGIDAARKQVSRNMGLIFALLAPTILGFWMILPSFEAIFIPAKFHGAFSHYLTMMLPGMSFYVLTMYCVAPAFQITHRTAPVIFSGLAAFVANGAALMLLPRLPGAGSYALAQTISSWVGFATGLVFLYARDPIWPPLREVGATLIGSAAMLIVAWILRTITPGAGAMAAQIFVCVGFYGAVMITFNVAQIRTILADRLRRLAPSLQGQDEPMSSTSHPL